MPDHARPEDVAAFAAGWDDSLIECRVDRHLWKPLDAGYSPEDQVYERTQRCPRCLVERHQIISLRTGQMLKNVVSYKQTDGYLMPKGTGYLTSASRDAIRLEMFSRLAGVPAEPKLRSVAANGSPKRATARRTRRKKAS